MTVWRSQLLLSLAGLLTCGAHAGAQDLSFTTTFQGGKQSDGCMFDVVALRNLRIKGLAAHVAAGAATLEIYVRPDTYKAAINAPSLWTLVAQTPVIGQGVGLPTPVNAALDVVIPAGARFGFYVTNTGGAAQPDVQTTLGLGQIFTDGLNLAVLQGIGNAYPFGAEVDDMLFNGTLVYQTLGLAGTPHEVSVSQGGLQTMGLSPGPQFADMPYLLVGSLSGTSPGFFINGFTLPINFDLYTLLTLSAPNAPPLSGSFGFLDPLGLGACTFQTPPGLSPAFVGTTVNHAFVVIQVVPAILGKVVFASEPLPLTFVP
jgi:hypothetical protein